MANQQLEFLFEEIRFYAEKPLRVYFNTNDFESHRATFEYFKRNCATALRLILDRDGGPKDLKSRKQISEIYYLYNSSVKKIKNYVGATNNYLTPVSETWFKRGFHTLYA